MQVRKRYTWPILNKSKTLIIYFLLNYLLFKTKHNKTITFIHICTLIFFLHIICIIVDFQFYSSAFPSLTFCSPLAARLMTSGDVINFSQCQCELLSVIFFCLAKQCLTHNLVHTLSSQFLLWGVHIIWFQTNFLLETRHSTFHGLLN